MTGKAWLSIALVGGIVAAVGAHFAFVHKSGRGQTANVAQNNRAAEMKDGMHEAMQLEPARQNWKDDLRRLLNEVPSRIAFDDYLTKPDPRITVNYDYATPKPTVTIKIDFNERP